MNPQLTYFELRMCLNKNLEEATRAWMEKARQDFSTIKEAEQAKSYDKKIK
jgi:hypothetical protein